MIIIRLLVAGLAVALSLGAARAVDRDPTGGIAPPAAVEPVQDAAIVGDTARNLAVTLPEQSVTTTAAPKPLPPLKPLPKWDPRVCIGC
jgi:hypothetical protein